MFIWLQLLYESEIHIQVKNAVVAAIFMLEATRLQRFLYATEFGCVMFKTGSSYIVLNDLKETVLLPQLLIAGIVSMCHLIRLPHVLAFVFVLINRLACNQGWLTHTLLL